MSTIRDRALVPLDRARAKIQQVGLRRFAVTLRRRIWAGAYAGDGAVTVQDIVLTPMPRVRFHEGGTTGNPAALEYIIANGNQISDRLYKIDKITPFFTRRNGSTGGYTVDQLRMRPSPDVANVEPIVIMVGDDGYARECVQKVIEHDRSFGYSMIVAETDRPRAALSSIAITRGALTQLIATGTFEDGMASHITPICMWRSDAHSIATVDLLGKVTEVGSGTAHITAFLGTVGSGSFSYVVP